MDNQNNNRIVIDSQVMVGKPVIRGTRITVELILRQLAQGATVDGLLRNYPHLELADVQAALDYATHLLEDEIVYPLTPQAHAQTGIAIR